MGFDLGPGEPPPAPARRPRRHAAATRASASTMVLRALPGSAALAGALAWITEHDLIAMVAATLTVGLLLASARTPRARTPRAALATVALVSTAVAGGVLTD